MRRLARGNAFGIARHTRGSRTPVKSRALGLAVRGRARVIAIRNPRAIIRRKNHHRIICHGRFLQSARDLSHGPIYFHHHIGIQAHTRFALKRIAAKQGHMRHIVGDVQEKRLVRVACDKIDRVLGVPSRQHLLLFGRHIVDGDFPIFPKLQFTVVKVPALRMVLPHVIGIHQPRGLVKPPSGRARVRLIANMPLAKHPRGVPGRLEHLGHRGKTGIQPACPGRNRPIDLVPARITPSQQRSPRRRTDRLRHVKLVVATPPRGQIFHMGCGIRCLPKGPKISPSGIVQKNHHKIGSSAHGVLLSVVKENGLAKCVDIG